MNKAEHNPILKAAKPAKFKTEVGLAVVSPNVAGIDIGSREMYVCGPVNEQGEREVRTFDTTTVQIEACAKWLKQQKVESVAMESTGVYWIPVLEILEDQGLKTLLVDTRPMSRVPGRKTDTIDCKWIQTLHSVGLLQGCFRPAEEISQLRNLTRQKAVLVSEQADWTRRLHKSLDQMNVRVHHAVSDTQGTTGMAIIRAIVKGERDPWKLASLRDARCQKSEAQIAALLTGNWRQDHLFNLEQSLKMYDTLADQIADYEEEIQKHMARLTPPENQNQQAPPLSNREKVKAIKKRNQEDRRQALFRMVGVDLTTIDGIGVETAEAIVSEYGIDLSQFPTEGQFVKHLKLAPRQSVTGGKQIKKGRGKAKTTRSGAAFRNAAVVLGRSPSALGAYYRRISRGKGATVAVFATARKLATLTYRMLRWGQDYVDIGQEAYEQRFQESKLRALASTAAQFGLDLIKKETPVNA